MRNGTGGKKKRKKKASSQPVTERNHPRDSFKILYRKESGYIISLGAIPTLWPLRWQFTSFLPGEKNSTFPRRPVIILLCFRRPSFTTNGKFLSLCASTRDENKRRRKTRQPNTLRVSHLLFTTATILYINIVKRKKEKNFLNEEYGNLTCLHLNGKRARVASRRVHPSRTPRKKERKTLTGNIQQDEIWIGISARSFVMHSNRIIGL